MSNFSRRIDDDENDTLAFERWEAYVVEHYPNPQRYGCPDRQTLKRFVDTPGQVRLQDLNDTHITRCRECVQDLKELRLLREQTLNKYPSAPAIGSWRTWRTTLSVAAACLVLIVVGAVTWRHQTSKSLHPTQVTTVVKVAVDLSGDGVLRGKEDSTSKTQVTLPRAVVDLDLSLPYYSPAGQYRVTIRKAQEDQPVRSASGNAVASGPHTDLQVRLDLRDLNAGNYLLGTTHDGEPTYFYHLVMN